MIIDNLNRETKFRRLISLQGTVIFKGYKTRSKVERFCVKKKLRGFVSKKKG
jgi:hypothetical protein